GLAAAVTDLPEQLQRLLVVGGSLVMVALPMADLAQSGQRPGLRVFVAGLAGEGQRSGVEIAGLSGLAGGQQGFPGTVECLGLAIAVADLPEQLQRLLIAAALLLARHLAVPDPDQPGHSP